MEKNDIKKIEELFYTFGDVSKNIGRIETDGKNDNMKKYDKLCRERDSVVSEFSLIIKKASK
jgi:hypothetical protein